MCNCKKKTPLTTPVTKIITPTPKHKQQSAGENNKEEKEN
jgi:hypothetical protein